MVYGFQLEPGGKALIGYGVPTGDTDCLRLKAQSGPDSQTDPHQAYNT